MAKVQDNKGKRLVGAMYRPMCKILILVGIATLLLAMVNIWQYHYYSKRTSQTTATVSAVTKINVAAGKDEAGNNIQKCRIHYEFALDNVEYTDSLGYRGDSTTEKCTMAVGDTITVNYDANHPSNNAYNIDDRQADHRTLSDAIASAVSITIVGVIPIAIGVFGLYLVNSHKSDKKASNKKLTKVKRDSKVKETKDNDNK